MKAPHFSLARRLLNVSTILFVLPLVLGLVSVFFAAGASTTVQGENGLGAILLAIILWPLALVFAVVGLYLRRKSQSMFSQSTTGNRTLQLKHNGGTKK